MTPDRQRLWEIFEAHSTKDLPPDSVVVLTPIATSGHPLHLINLASYYARIIRELDPKLDQPNYIAELYAEAKIPVPDKPKLRWHFEYLKLGLLDESSNVFFALCQGPN
jgi:hypothetical protein